jgi:FkbM family methyltransferase
MTDSERVEIAARCKDCETIPKVENAGTVVRSPEGDYQIMHNGLKVRCDSHYGPYNVEVIRRLRGHHEPQEEVIFHRVLGHIAQGGVMVELGSFWAYYALWFLSEVKAGKAILVEPIAGALEAGRRNFQLNGYRGTFVRAAIGGAVLPEASVELWPGMTVNAPRTTVDELMREHQLSGIDLLHADIQGAEVSMLHGASQALAARSIRWLFISTHGENLHQRCLQILRRYGYVIEAEHSPGESFSVDGLIVSCSARQLENVKISKRRSWHGRKAKWRAAIRVSLLEPIGLKPITT